MYINTHKQIHTLTEMGEEEVGLGELGSLMERPQHLRT